MTTVNAVPISFVFNGRRVTDTIRWVDSRWTLEGRFMQLINGEEPVRANWAGITEWLGELEGRGLIADLSLDGPIPKPGGPGVVY